VCPQGTFNLSYPWLTCQPCKISCSYCYNYTVCFQCKPHYFYFNSTTFACQRCGQHCLTCDNDTHCRTCEEGYLMGNWSCSEQGTLAASCGGNC
jgi:hypothetical protein